MRKILLCVVVLLIVPIVAHAKELPKENVVPSKEWDISFNMEMDPNTINEDTVFVTDQNGNKINGISPYINQETMKDVKVSGLFYGTGEYTLHITEGVKSVEGDPLKEGVTKQFEIKNQTKDSVTKVLQENFDVLNNQINLEYLDFSIDTSKGNGYVALLDKEEVKYIEENKEEIKPFVKSWGTTIGKVLDVYFPQQNITLLVTSKETNETLISITLTDKIYMDIK